MTEAKRPALLLVDLMNHFHFPGGDALRKATRRIVAAVRHLRERFDRAGHPVIYANDN